VGKMTAKTKSTFMNARVPFKLASLLGMSLLLALDPSLARAEGVTAAEVSPPTGATNVSSRYDIEIVNGHLLVAPLKGHADVKAIWGPGDLHGVSATINNLAEYLRAENPSLNIVVSPGAGEVVLSDFKLRSDDMKAVCDAVSIATESRVRGSTISGKDSWSFMTQPRPHPARTVEVFNLSSYIQSLGKIDDNTLNQKLSEMEEMINTTLNDLHPGEEQEHPNYRYHAGAHLFIVTGSPEAIDVSRKIIEAASGQRIEDIERGLLDKVLPANQK
jgi:hypothetical protein